MLKRLYGIFNPTWQAGGHQVPERPQHSLRVLQAAEGGLNSLSRYDVLDQRKPVSFQCDQQKFSENSAEERNDFKHDTMNCYSSCLYA